MNIEPSKSYENFHQLNKYIKNKQFKCVFLNIRSIKKNFDNFIISINSIIKEIDLIILAETNITDDENELYKIEGFCSEYRNREKRRGGGIAVYIKQNINYTIELPESESFESMIIHLNLNNQKTPVIATYRPPGKTNVKTFIREMKQLLIKQKLNKNLLIIGDINIDMSKKTTDYQNYMDLICDLGLKSCNSLPTREDIKKKSSTNIDHALLRVKSFPARVSAGTITTPISDHHALFIAIEYTIKPIPANNCIQHLHYIDPKLVNENIAKTDWSATLEKQTSEEILKTFVDNMQEIYKNSSFARKQTRCRRQHTWISLELINLCSKRDGLYKKWKADNTNKEKERAYKSLRNDINKKFRNAKNSFYRNEFKNANGDIRKTWQVINKILGRNKTNTDDQIRKHLKKQDNIIANEFAENFNKEIQNVMHHCNKKCLLYNKNYLQQSFYLEITTEQEIYNILQTINTNKGAGIDNIRPIDLKCNADIFAPILTKFINATIEESNIPESLKTAIIRPIYKNGCKAELTNYRPISILSTIDKIMEEIMVTRLKNFVKKHQIINNRQYGFQEGKNINKLLGDFNSHLNEAKSKKEHSLIIYVDYKKAFDTLDHKKIIECLNNIGIRGIGLQWIENYLTRRQYKVKIGEEKSNPIEMTQGVPQGSKLGPLLYILYTNEIFKVLKKSTVFAYADDIALIVSDKEYDKAKNTLQAEFDILTKWSHDNGLIINATKTNAMHIPPSKKATHNLNIYVNNEPCNNLTTKTTLRQVDEIKYLGVIVDNKLSWKKHIDEVRKKLRKTLYYLYYLKYKSNNFVMKQTYFSLAESYLRFGITAWGKSTHCKTLEKMQRKILKFLTEEDRREILDIKSLYKVTMINTYYDSSRKYLVKINHNQNTRSKANGKFEMPKNINSYGQQTLQSTIPEIFNELPPDILSMKYEKKRKKMIKNLFLN